MVVVVPPGWPVAAGPPCPAHAGDGGASRTIAVTAGSQRRCLGVSIVRLLGRPITGQPADGGPEVRRRIRMRSEPPRWGSGTLGGQTRGYLGKAYEHAGPVVKTVS